MYLEYDLLVGEADGGTPLPPTVYKQLQVESRSQRAPAPSTPPLSHTLCTGSSCCLLPGQTLRHMAQRLRCRAVWPVSRDAKPTLVAGVDCYNVGPATRCACLHSYRAHRWWELETKHVGCRVPGCPCRCYSYVPMRGSCAARCVCKHELEQHRLGGRCCKCSCALYAPPQRCDCGMSHQQHSTCFETRSQRLAGGRAAVAVGGGRPEVEAATGAVTDLMSLLAGGERVAMLQAQHQPHPLLLQQHSQMRALLAAASPSQLIRIHGVKGPNALKVNGSYVCGEERQGGQLLWRAAGGSAVIECMPSRRSWQVKPETGCEAVCLSTVTCCV
jgi:hypothetical protein